MRKTFVFLLVSAIGVWGYVVMQIILSLLGRVEEPSRTAGNDPLPGAAMLLRVLPPLDTSFRDPFQSFLYSEKPVPKVVKPVVKALPKAIEPPRATLNGILWGDAPVAILKQDGQTEVVKEGAEIWDLKVIKIERNQVTVRKQGKQFTLGY
jgi:hypothetical protein